MSGVNRTGRILDERTCNASGETVQMVYWGMTADPKVTIEVKNDKLSFSIAPPLDDLLDCYHHPHAYQDQYACDFAHYNVA